MTPSPPTVIAALAAADESKPLITFYDDATGERLDLSGATLRNWVAKTANLLVDGLGLGPGDLATVRLPPHWLTAAVLLGCWSAGLAVGTGGGEVTFTTGDDPDAEGDVYALSLAALAAPFRPGPPAGTLDFVVEVRPYGDHASPRITPGDAALADGTTHEALVSAARDQAPAGRLLIDAARTPDPRDWLVAPLVAGASIVLCVNLDEARLPARLATEHATPWP